MRHYEVMVILDPDLEERTVAPVLDKFLNVVRKDGGTVEKVDVWGRRRLAYEINKKAEGIYAVIDLTAEPARSRSSTASSTSTSRCCAPRSSVRTPTEPRIARSRLVPRGDHRRRARFPESVRTRKVRLTRRTTFHSRR